MNPTTGSDTFTLKGFTDMLIILQGGAKNTFLEESNEWRMIERR